MLSRIRRRIVRRLLRALGKGETPHRLAKSFAVGVAIGFSPFLAFHIAIALVLAWIFRLRKLDVVLGTFTLNNPWTVVPIYSGATTLGWVLLGNDPQLLGGIPWDELTSLRGLNRPETWTALRPFAMALALGTSIFSLVGGLATYAGIRSVMDSLVRRRRTRALRREEQRLARRPAVPPEDRRPPPR